MSQFTILCLISIMLSGCSLVISPLAGDVTREPSQAKELLSTEASGLIDHAFEGVDLRCLADVHLHAMGNGSKGTVNWVNPNMNAPLIHPYKYIQYQVYLKAGGIEHPDSADQEYIQYIVRMLRAEPKYGKALLFALDYVYLKNGTRDKEHSTFYVDNEYVYAIARQYPQYFIPVVSIHPYRKDAIAELHKWADRVSIGV